MIYDERVQAKVAVVFKIVDSFLSGKEIQESTKSQLHSEMNMIRPIQFEAVKRELGHKIENSISPDERSKLIDLFSPYLVPPYERLETGHPLRNYTIENQIIREHLLNIDSSLGDTITKESWQYIYKNLLAYKKHIERQQINFYKVISTYNMDVQVEKAIEIGNSILQILEVNSRKLENDAYFEFLLDQQSVVQMLMNYLDIEERVLFAKALHVLDSKALIILRALDDQIGYTFEGIPEVFIPKGIQIVPQKLKEFEAVTNSFNGFEWLLPALVNSKKMKLILFNTSGEVISKFGDLIEADDLKISQKTLEFINRGGCFQKRYWEKKGNAVFEVIYTYSAADFSIKEAVIIKTIEPFFEYNLEESEFCEKTVDAEGSIQSLFEQYPQFKKDFFNLDEALMALKMDPLSSYILSESTVSMVAKSLRIDVEVLVARIDELIHKYEKENALNKKTPLR